MEYLSVESSQIPIKLLLEADPSEHSIAQYLADAWCFAARDNNQILGACIVKPVDKKTAEIFNIAVAPEFQGFGIGSELLKFTLSALMQNGITNVGLGTGAFGYQLTFYQRAGFRVESVVKDHFLLNYPEPIFENGIQHKDMLRLGIRLHAP